MKQIFVMFIIISVLNISVVIGIYVERVDNLTEQQLNITNFKNNSSENSNLFRDDKLKEAIEKCEKGLGGIKFNNFIKQVNQKKVQHIFDDGERNKLLNIVINYNNYKLLCLGNISLTTKMQSKLKCRYVHREIPFLKIAPFKEEEAYLEPRIVIFHDVLYQKEIETVKRLAQPKMRKAKFTDLKTGKRLSGSGRITDTAWLDREDHTHLEMVHLRVQLMTGLSLISAEPLQVAYYPLQGKYEPHYDFESRIPQTIDTSPPNFSDRVATVLFYLNNVEEGGNTVFTKLDLSLTPKSGSAAFWYNIKPNGFRDYLTMHAACPVISGTKWAANLWIHEYGQEFYRPCTLDNQPRDEEWERFYVSLEKEKEEKFSKPTMTSNVSKMREIQNNKYNA